MKKRKVLAMVLALALTLGLAAPAMAATEDPVPTPTVSSDGTSNVTVKVIMNLPTIKVTIGNAPTLIVNPYKLDYNVHDNTSVAQESVVSLPVLITSQSAIDLDVTATPTGQSTGTDAVSFLTTPVTDNTTKSVFLFLELAGVLAANITDTDDFGVSWKTAASTDIDTDTKCAVVKTEGDTDATYTLTKPATFGGSSYCAFKLSGNCADSRANWTSENKISVSVAFTFAPKPATVSP